MKSYTDLKQSKKLAEILPLESADMTLPFRHSKNDEYIPGYVVSRNYVEVYNEMMKLSAMEKEDVCKLIQPSWSLAALIDVLPEIIHIKDWENYIICIDKDSICYKRKEEDLLSQTILHESQSTNLVDACYEMILKLNKLNLL